MKKALIIIGSIICFVCLSNLSFADELKYNPFLGEWSYERPNTQLKYNPFKKQWEWAE